MDIRELQQAFQWFDAFFDWYESGDKVKIVDLLRKGTALDRQESYLLAHIVSGEWTRPKKFGESKGVTGTVWKDAERNYYIAEVKRIQAKLKAAKLPGQRVNLRKEAIEEMARNGKPFPGRAGHSEDTIEKLMRRPEKQYQKKSQSAYDAFNDDLRRILAKMEK